MIGKILRFAFLEKDARKRWEAAAAAKQAAKAAPARPPARQTAPQPTPQPTHRPADPPAEAPDDAAAIRAAIDAAHAEMTAGGSAAGRPDRSAAVPADLSSGDRESERRQLIRSALTVHKLKQSALDDLDPKQRAQLRAMAEKMLGVDKSAR